MQWMSLSDGLVVADKWTAVGVVYYSLLTLPQ